MKVEIAGILHIVGLPFLRSISSDEDLRKEYWNRVAGKAASYEDVCNLCALEAMRGNRRSYEKAVRQLVDTANSFRLSKAVLLKKLAEIEGLWNRGQTP